MARSSAKTDSKRSIRKQQQDWLREVMRITGHKASHLAQAGGVSNTTLTRFLNKEDYDGVLSPLTVSRIASAAGVPTPGTPAGPRDIHDEGDPCEAGSQPDFAEAIQQYLQGHPQQRAWRIKIETLLLAGVRAGDLLIVDESLQPQPGDVVTAQIEHGLGARTIFRLWQPPMLLGAATDPAAVKPEIVDGDRVRITGVMVALLRTRQGAVVRE